MKQTIQYFFKPEQPVAPHFLRCTVDRLDLSAFLTSQDILAIGREWKKVIESHPRVFSVPEGIGSLWDTMDLPTLHYATTDFQTYVTTSRLADQGKRLSADLSDALRISAVGCAVLLADGSTLVHRRPQHSSHVPDKYDSGIAGLAHVQPDRTLDLVQAMQAKFARELNIDDSYLSDLRLLSVHGSSAPDFSGMVDFSILLPLTFAEIQERANPLYLEGMLAIPQRELPAYIRRSFAERDDLIADGAAVLLSSLPHDQFLKVIEDMNAIRRTISFGQLRDGRFEESLFPAVVKKSLPP